MPLKRPVTVAQARRWPAAAKRRQSFCARMGGMRERLTGERAARDPASPINRALAAWDCDEPELLRAEHVSKGIRMKITKGKVGSEARMENPPIGVKWLPKKGKPKITYAILPKTSAGRGVMLGEFSTKARAEEYMRSLTSPWNYRIKKIEEYEYEDPPEENPVRKRAAPARKTPAKKTPEFVYAAYKVGMKTPMALFATRDDAVQFAQAWANVHKHAVQIVRELAR